MKPGRAYGEERDEHEHVDEEVREPRLLHREDLGALLVLLGQRLQVVDRAHGRRAEPRQPEH